MTRDLIDDATVERCARAAFEAVMAGRREYRLRPADEWRVAARAVLTEALQPAPDPDVIEEP